MQQSAVFSEAAFERLTSNVRRYLCICILLCNLISASVRVCGWVRVHFENYFERAANFVVNRLSVIDIEMSLSFSVAIDFPV